MMHIFHTDKTHEEWMFNNVHPDGPEVKRLHRFLLDHKQDECELYHGTLASLPIGDEGLKPTSARTKKSLQSQNGYVYLSVYPNMALSFAQMAYPQKEVAVYPVRIQIAELKPDKDQIFNKRLYSGMEIEKDTLAVSLAIGHGARVKRKIWPYEIGKPISFAETK